MTLASTKINSIELVIAGDLAGVGAAWIPIDDGVARWSAVDDPVGSWRQALLVGAMPVREAVRRHLAILLAEDGGTCELFPGVFAIGCVSETRRGRCEGIAILATDELITEGSLSMLCNASKVDETVIRGFALRDSLPPSAAIPAITDLVQRLHTSARRRIEEREAAHSVDRRLSESYEELHLLNSLIDGLVVGGDPGDFLVSATEELAATAGYSWIAILLDDPGGCESRRLRGPRQRGAPTRAEVRLIAESASTSTATAVVIDPTFGEIGTCGRQRRRSESRHAGRRGPGRRTDLQHRVDAAGIRRRSPRSVPPQRGVVLGSGCDVPREHCSRWSPRSTPKDPYTRGHSQRVAILSRDLAAAIGLPEAFVKTAHLSGLVHDIGKIGVPEAVLCKAGRLTDDSEFAAIRQHPQIGFRILQGHSADP